MSADPAPVRAEDSSGGELKGLQELLLKVAKRGRGLSVERGPDQQPEIIIVEDWGDTRVRVAQADWATFAAARSAGLLEATAAGVYRLSGKGRSLVRQARSRKTLAGAAVPDSTAGDGRPYLGPQRNDAESPLTWMRRRLDKDGRPLVSDPQFDAGERLRSELWLAQMTPRTTQAWSGVPLATTGAPPATARRLTGGSRPRNAGSCLKGGYGPGIGPDALDHRLQAVGTLRGQMLAELEPGQYGVGIDRQDLARCLARVDRKQDRDKAADDVCVAITGERKHLIVAARGALCGEPDLARATPHLVVVVPLGGLQGFQHAAKLDDIAVAVFPIIEEREIRADIVQAWNAAHAPAFCGLMWLPLGPAPALVQVAEPHEARADRQPALIRLHVRLAPDRSHRKGGGRLACKRVGIVLTSVSRRARTR